MLLLATYPLPLKRNQKSYTHGLTPHFLSCNCPFYPFPEDSKSHFWCDRCPHRFYPSSYQGRTYNSFDNLHYTSHSHAKDSICHAPSHLLYFIRSILSSALFIYLFGATIRSLTIIVLSLQPR